jgi:deazaflavin-dependent oxidoreductase (nitroreductase family)
MSRRSEPEFLYLTTTGWKTGRPHEIEIWFTELDGRYYIISEMGERSHWVRNLQRDPRVSFKVGRREAAGMARVVDPEREAELHARVCARSVAKYEWGEGTIVELKPLEAESG